jgi:hypothetical protein
MTAEWQANLKPVARRWPLKSAVPFVNMETGASPFSIYPSAVDLETTAETSVAGVGYAMTGFSVARGNPFGFLLKDLASASVGLSPVDHFITPQGDNMDDKTATDEKALFDAALKMLTGGKDGIEAGLTTTEFWLYVLALGVDVLGPYFGFLQGIDSQEQLGIATLLVMSYGALRSWRKRGGPQKAYAELLKVLAQLHGQAAASAPEPSAPLAVAAELPKAA